MSVCIYIYIYIYCIYIYIHTHTHTHITSLWAGYELHEVGIACCGVVNIGPLRTDFSSLCFDIIRYLFTAIGFTLVHKRQEQNMHKENEYRTHKTKHIKQHNKI